MRFRDDPRFQTLLARRAAQRASRPREAGTDPQSLPMLPRRGESAAETRRQRQQRLTGPPRRLLDYVLNAGNWTAASASSNGIMVVLGPGSTDYRILQWTDASGVPLDSVILGGQGRIWTARRSRPEAWVYDFAAGAARRLFEDRGDAAHVRFSPDGRWIAWESSPAQGTRPDVYLRPADGPGASVRLSSDGGSRPRWSRDGRELYYWMPNAIMVVSVRPDATPMLSAPRVLRAIADGGAAFDVAADGSLVLDIQRGGMPGFTLLQDWTELLEREERRR